MAEVAQVVALVGALTLFTLLVVQSTHGTRREGEDINAQNSKALYGQ